MNQSFVGILWMVLTTILFVGVTATVRYLEGEVPAPQAAFLRYAIGTILLIPSLISLTKFKPEKPSRFKRIANYLGEVRTELKRVNWPSSSTLYAFTVVTIVTIGFFTFFIFGMDFSFKNTLINLLSFGE